MRSLHYIEMVRVGDPLVVSILDGNTLRLFLEDEDDFAMLAENLFTDLDVEDKGKISQSEIRNALVQMGVEMGVPPFSGSLYFFCFGLPHLFFSFSACSWFKVAYFIKECIKETWIENMQDITVATKRGIFCFRLLHCGYGIC